MRVCFSGLRFWGELWILRRAVNDKLWSHCPRVLLNVLLCECVFPPTLAAPGSGGGAVFDGVTATPSCPFPLLGVEPASELGCLRNLHVEGVWVVPRHLWESRGVARASHGKSTCKSEVEFQPGCRYFPAFDVLFSHLYNRWEVEKGWVEWSLLFLCLCGMVHGVTVVDTFSNTAWAISLLGQARLSMNCRVQVQRAEQSHTQFSFFR